MDFLRTEDSALLVVDAQNGFYDTGRADVDWTQFQRVITRCAWVCAVARELSVPVIVTEEDAERNGATAQEIRNELPNGTESLAKRVFSAPDNPEILAAIKDLNVASLVLVGIETDVCIAHSALRLKTQGFRAVVIEDAVYSPGDAHRMGLDRMRGAGVELLSAKELLFDWLPTLVEIRHFRAQNPDLSVQVP